MQRRRSQTLFSGAQGQDQRETVQTETQEVPLNIRKRFLYLLVVECCHRLPGMVVESPFSEIFKSLNMVLGNLLEGEGRWVRWPSEVSSDLNCSVITRVHFAVSSTEPLNKERFVVLFVCCCHKAKESLKKWYHLFFLSTSNFLKAWDDHIWPNLRLSCEMVYLFKRGVFQYCDSSVGKIANSRCESTKAGKVKPGVVVSSMWLQHVSHCSFRALGGSGGSACTDGSTESYLLRQRSILVKNFLKCWDVWQSLSSWCVIFFSCEMCIIS